MYTSILCSFFSVAFFYPSADVGVMGSLREECGRSMCRGERERVVCSAARARMNENRLQLRGFDRSVYIYRGARVD